MSRSRMAEYKVHPREASGDDYGARHDAEAGATAPPPLPPRPAGFSLPVVVGIAASACVVGLGVGIGAGYEARGGGKPVPAAPAPAGNESSAPTPAPEQEAKPGACMASAAWAAVWESELKPIVEGSWGVTYAFARPCNKKQWWEGHDETRAQFYKIYNALLEDWSQLLPRERNVLMQVRDRLDASAGYMTSRLSDPRTPYSLHVPFFNHRGFYQELIQPWFLTRFLEGSGIRVTGDDAFTDDLEYWVQHYLHDALSGLHSTLDLAVRYGFTYGERVCDWADQLLLDPEDGIQAAVDRTAHLIDNMACNDGSNAGFCDKLAAAGAAGKAVSADDARALLDFWTGTYRLHCKHDAYQYTKLPKSGVAGFTFSDPAASTDDYICDYDGQPLFSKACGRLRGDCVDPETGLDYSAQGLLTTMYGTTVMNRTNTLDEIWAVYQELFDAGKTASDALEEGFLDALHPASFANAAAAKAQMSDADKSRWFQYHNVHVRGNFLCGDAAACYDHSTTDHLGLPEWGGCFRNDADTAGRVRSDAECEALPPDAMRIECPKRAECKRLLHGFLNEAENGAAAVVDGYFAARGEHQLLTACRMTWRVNFQLGISFAHFVGRGGTESECPPLYYAQMYINPSGIDATASYNLWLTYHEAVLGHGFQIPAMTEAGGADPCGYPSMYTRGNGVITEGYATYAEQVLAREMGLYSAPLVNVTANDWSVNKRLREVGGRCLVDMCLAMGNCTWEEARENYAQGDEWTTIRAATTLGQTCWYGAGMNFYKRKAAEFAARLDTPFHGRGSLRPHYEQTLQQNADMHYAVLEDVLEAWWAEVAPGGNQRKTAANEQVPIAAFKPKPSDPTQHDVASIPESHVSSGHHDV